MLDDCQPDLVSLAVPTSLHYEIGAQLLRRGVHVLVEKPIASTIEEAEALIALAQRHGALLGVGHIERFNPAVEELQRRLCSGMAGRIYKIHTQRLSPYPPRIRDAGVIIDLASHDIDLIRYLMKDEILRVYGETTRGINSDREDMFNGLIRFRSGAVGVLDVDWMTPTKIRTLTVTGACGMFICNLLSQELFFYENADITPGWDTLSILRGVTEGNMTGIRVRRHEPLAAELADFVTAVREGHEPAVSGESGTETLRLATEFLQSGQNVEVVFRDKVLVG
jgi:predicted dehydrogenase